MTEGPVLIVFLGGMGGSPAEDLVRAALAAAALDLLDEALETQAFERAILVTDDATISARSPLGVIVDVDRERLAVEAVCPVAAWAGDSVVVAGLDVEVVGFRARALQALKRPASVVGRRPRLGEGDTADPRRP